MNDAQKEAYCFQFNLNMAFDRGYDLTLTTDALAVEYDSPESPWDTMLSDVKSIIFAPAVTANTF